MKIAVKIDSFRKLYDERYNHLVIYSEKLGVPSSVSEDIVQEAYVRLWENWKSVANPTAYLFRTVRNSSVDYFRTHSKLHSVTLESVPSFFLEDDALEDILEYFDKLEEISRKVESLPDKCREVIRKIYFENKRISQTAEELGVSENTVKTHLRRGKDILKLTVFIILLKIF